MSQGHSDAIRQLPGVLDARQYTIPNADAVEKARLGRYVPMAGKHRRECFVVAAPGADREKIKEQIINMPHYFAPYETSVTFVSKEELDMALPHGGRVIGGAGQMELTLATTSNPMLTGAVLTAYGRAAYRLDKEGIFGAKTPLDVPVSYLCAISAGRYI